ncbi:ABC transporter ATP-binding protein/permease [Lacrimispora sp. NSJ-141]|uniref:ABC transporter ATP-binding protein/permease n=1 Tax=Lientehia hominis TaxID=2897778 RepID=A0AAP2RJZ0_9FIRM|nr:ABC transporter ATP-binding protein [Lientehia hominis]MCD2493010.1 ABC transporter ATP-binding protein/permease [Lientehia hominis]
MIEALKRIWDFSGKERGNINKSIAFCFLNAVFHMFQVGAIYFVVLALVDGTDSLAPALLAIVLMLLSIIGGAATKSVSQLQQTHAGYFMAANSRIGIADRLKSVPMGYFNDNSLGEITGVSTTTLDNIETIAPRVLVMVLSGFITTAVFLVMVFSFDWRIGLIVLTGVLLYLLITSKMQKKSIALAPLRQKSETVLVEAVLEYVQGMSVVKSFNLTGRGDKTVQDALEFNRKSNSDLEKLFTPYVMVQGAALQIAGVCMMLASAGFFLAETIHAANALMVVIMSFLVFAQIESAGSSLSILRVVTSCIEKVEELDSMPQMDERGESLKPVSHDINFENVSFSYEKREILHEINLTIPNKTTTAVIGPSGSGKTTLCSLIARFWDVDSGSVKVGGRDVRDYTLESLMDQISVVFQNVYLFADTIENNIKFGCPDATREQVIEAARKACCDDFIEALPDGYNTLIGEGGASLSGGERQRISIARAMLKDAPIIILDEATANVDPENEDRLQKAIEELTRNKTIIMIAHRLKTVRNADQILVIDGGCIVQKGRHEELIEQPGIYADFVTGRKESIGWKLSAV